MRTLVVPLILITHLLLTSCSKDKVEVPVVGNPTPTAAPCNPLVDTVFTSVTVSYDPDSINPSSNYQIHFTNVQNDNWEITFIDEPVSGVYTLSDSLIDSTFAEIHVFENSWFRWISINTGAQLVVENNATQMILSFCNLTLQNTTGGPGDSVWGFEKKFVYNK